MRIILAAPRGFCAGVNMAIESLEMALALYGTPIYVYHEIVHNRWVVEHFREKGAVFVNELDEVPEGSYLLFSAHGISPAIREQSEARRLKTIDATCPLVTKVHREAIRFARDGYTILLIGHAGHDEVTGTMGEAPEAFRLVQTIEDAATIEVDKSERLAFLTQTTLSVTETADIISKLKDAFRKSSLPRRKISAMPRRIDRRLCGLSAIRLTCCWLSVVATVRTAAAWPSWARCAVCLPT